MAYETTLGTLDFDRCEKAARRLSDAQLAAARKDARETAELWDGHDGPNAGKYRDEASVYAAEMRRRLERELEREERLLEKLRAAQKRPGRGGLKTAEHVRKSETRVSAARRAVADFS